MSDESEFFRLMQRVRQGDQHAASELVIRYERELRIITRARLNSPRLRRVLDTIDVYNSVLGNFFVRVSSGQFDIKSSSGLLKLLAEMIWNRITDHEKAIGAIKRGGRLQQHSIDDLALTESSESPIDAIGNNDLLLMFRAKLTPEFRRIHDMLREGLTWPEIAQREQASHDALRKRYSRAVDDAAAALGFSRVSG